MSAAETVVSLQSRRRPGTGAQELFKEHASNELVFAVVGHVGSGTSFIAEALQNLLSSRKGYEVEMLKAREVIVDWARRSGKLTEEPKKTDLKHAINLQDWGDEMRSSDATAVARSMVERIRLARARMQRIENPGVGAVLPDGKPRAYIIDAIRHPAEAHLLRSLYRNAFALVGVVCQEDIRLERLQKTKFTDAGQVHIKKFMERDAKEKDPKKKKHGQRVSDAFHLADFFVDNSEERQLEDGGQLKDNPNWRVDEHLVRLVRIITQSSIERPTSSETAMHAAYGAQMRSACLSRQVGAALIDATGNIVSTGANEVPRAGGGVYAQDSDEIAPSNDNRCAFRPEKYCSNTREQADIIEKVLEVIHEEKPLSAAERDALKAKLRDNSPVGELIEFSRAVHAEMDALLSAARQGASPQGCRLFVTTYPCHYCARHIVSAGVDEVQYIEPYPKSRALKLHGDSISHRAHEKGKKIPFLPFTGVAPRLYWRAFLKDREFKSKDDGAMSIGEPDWGSAWDISKLSHAEMEAKLLEPGPSNV
ncbi:anti-phage dCTP deaminase [Archangium primigenium]|uniref:anti-phage dCTP deaminase n=1 Tax=[Archangium] primigenium TaxID=2792470 RepID=UPI001959FA23|nr:anti-phage dCTP deaminase [Archangium primigenium]MBM7117817.1 cytidine deaminase [Archangium primigenium]